VVTAYADDWTLGPTDDVVTCATDVGIGGFVRDELRSGDEVVVGQDYSDRASR